MEKPKKLFIFSGIVICLITITLVIINSVNSDKVIYESDNANVSDNRVISSNALTMMYETEYQSGEYQISSDTTWPQEGYVFNEELSACENGSELSWDDENKSILMQTNTSDKCYVYFDVYVPPKITDICISGANLASCIKEFNSIAGDGAEGIYYHDGQGNYENANQEAGDNSYRYAGVNPNNYVCFGTTASTCPENNLYRIIGVFKDQIKLIKADYTTSDMLGTDGRDYYGSFSFTTSFYKGSMDESTIAAYRWNYDTSVSTLGSNNWTTSEFNTINLNTNYWNYLGSTWQNLIAETTWHLGGMTSNGNTAKAFYDGERNNAGYGSNPTTYTDEIGLMYPSDYGYAASPDAWAKTLSSYSSSTITANNWMYMGLSEWTLTPYSSNSNNVFNVNYLGHFLNSRTNAHFGFAARPVFYLESNVELSGGSGTSSDPYRLAV